MFEIISYLLIAAFFSLPLVLGMRLFLRGECIVRIWGGCFLLSTVVCYFLILFSVWVVGWRYEYELAQLDINGDGFFTGDEVTPESREAMKRLSHDTGRSFAPITGLVVSPIYNIFWFTAFSLLTYIKVRMKSRVKESGH